jgi:hypothetical protein
LFKNAGNVKLVNPVVEWLILTLRIRRFWARISESRPAIPAILPIFSSLPPDSALALNALLK